MPTPKKKRDRPLDAGRSNPACPKCGVEMEPIEAGEVEGLSIQQLQLCPGCYLVTWNDPDGIHIRQGVPVPDGDDPHRFAGVQHAWFSSEPEKC